jgi:uncharacterized membrane protein YcaP (DUF421 family)
MAAELITEEELMSQLRLQGIKDLSGVVEASVEPDGRISVVSGAGRAGHGQSEHPTV